MKYQSFGEIRSAAQECQACALAKTRTNVVFGEGSLHADIMLIGEGPGQQEDLSGRPFVGPAGQLLDKMLGSIGFSRDDVYIANIVKCRPPYNADPKPEYQDACIGYLREQLRFIHPKIIVLLGRIAMQRLLNTRDGITKMRGQVVERKGFYFIPTYHPAALLRNESLKRDSWEDLKTIKQLYEEVCGDAAISG